MSSIWAAAYTAPGCERRAQSGIEEAGFGTFLPTFVRSKRRRGLWVTGEEPLLTRYVLVHIPPERQHSWSEVNLVDGVVRLLEVEGQPLQIPEDEVSGLMMGHVSGRWNRIIKLARGRYSKRRRRPRR